MRKLISTLAVCFVALTQSLSADSCCGLDLGLQDTVIGFGVGYRHDCLEFRSKVGFDDSSSNLSSSSFNGDEIKETDKFEGLNMWQISAGARATFCQGIYVRADADYAQIVDGKQKVSFKFEPGSVIPGAASASCSDRLGIHAKADRGYAYDLSAGIGYEFSFCCDQFVVAPVVGYSYNVQHIRSKRFKLGSGSDSSWSSSSSSSVVFVESSDSSSSSSDFGSSSSSFYSSSSGSGSCSNGIKNTVNARWQGPWLGVDFVYNVDCDWNLYGSFQWHWASQHTHYKTRIDLDFDSSSSTGDFNSKYRVHANGPWFTLGTLYRFDECWSAGLEATYLTMHSSKGDNEKSSGVRLDSVRWNSFRLQGIVAYHF